MANVVEILVVARNATKEGFAAATAESETFSSKMQKVGMLGGAALGVIAVASVDMASKFDSSMTLLQTQAGVSHAKLQVLQQGVLDLAGQVGFSPDSLAESAYHVASNMESMGATSTQMLNAVKVAAEGAAVGHANLVDVTNALGAAIASGIPGVQDYQRAMGYLNATVGTGDMKMQDLADAFGTGLLASVKGFGLSIQDVGAALAVFGDNNIRGAKAGTDLRMVVEALAAPTKKGADLLTGMGMSVGQLADDMRTKGLLGALQDLRKHMEAAGYSANQSGQIITEMFGKKAGVGVQVLYNQLDRLQSKYPALAKGAGTFGSAWATTQQTLTQRMEEVRASFEALMIEIGNKLMPVVQKVFGWMADHSKDVAQITEVILALVAGLAAYAVAAKAVAIAQGIMNAVMEMNPFVAIATGIVVLAVLIIKYHKQIWDFITSTWSSVSKFLISTWNSIYSTGAAVWDNLYSHTIGTVIRLFSAIKSTITTGFDSWWASHGQAVEQVWSTVWAVVTAVFKTAWSVISTLAQAGWAVLKAVFTVGLDVIQAQVKVAWTVITSVFKVSFDVLKGIVTTAWDVMRTVFSVQIAAIKLIVKTAWDAVVLLFNVFLDVITGHWHQAWVDVETFAKQTWNNLQAFFKTTWAAVSSGLASVWHDIDATTRSVWNDVVKFLSGVGSAIVGLFKGAGKWLFSYGKAILQGLIDGFHSIWSAVANFFTSLPGKILGWLGIHSPPDWAIDAGKHIAAGIGIGMGRAQERVKTATQALAAIASGTVGGPGGVPKTGDAAEAQKVAMKMAALIGWTGGQWTDLNNVAMRESGWNMYAVNPSSGAYGIAQFINGPSEYAQYGGNSTTLSGQLTGFFNYIKQRYGNPAGAWQHELNYGWYDRGGWLQPGYTLAYNGTGQPERVGGSDGTVHIEISGGQSHFDQFMLQWLRENARIKGGGSVQKAFGRN